MATDGKVGHLSNPEPWSGQPIRKHWMICWLRSCGLGNQKPHGGFIRKTPGRGIKGTQCVKMDPSPDRNEWANRPKISLQLRMSRVTSALVVFHFFSLIWTGIISNLSSIALTPRNGGEQKVINTL